MVSGLAERDLKHSIAYFDAAGVRCTAKIVLYNLRRDRASGLAV